MSTIRKTNAFTNAQTYFRKVNALRQFSTSSAPTKKKVLSGIQPTGALHIGNYLGALKQWVDNQDVYDNMFVIVDLHAITSNYEPKRLRKETLQTAAMYIAAGIDPEKSNIFIQSHVRAHSELTWLFNCITPMTWLERMLQYKEKASQQGANFGVGLFDYPVLMAADILLYHADLVPVGEDQRQHLQLTREIARNFNVRFCSKGKAYFKEPQDMVVKEGARIMSLEDGTCKMSKSAPNEHSRINLLDSPDQIAAKIKRAKTDLTMGLEWDNPARPESHNLLTLYRAVTGIPADRIAEEVRSMPNSQFKPLLTEAVVAHLAPLQRRYAEVTADQAYLSGVLSRGREVAEGRADATVKRVKDLMGFYDLPRKA